MAQRKRRTDLVTDGATTSALSNLLFMTLPSRPPLPQSKAPKEPTANHRSIYVHSTDTKLLLGACQNFHPRLLCSLSLTLLQTVPSALAIVPYYTTFGPLWLCSCRLCVCGIPRDCPPTTTTPYSNTTSDSLPCSHSLVRRSRRTSSQASIYLPTATPRPCFTFGRGPRQSPPDSAVEPFDATVVPLRFRASQESVS